jgi:TonB family protein
VRPRRQGLGLLCGPSTSPLDVMRGTIWLITALSGFASQASADVPECLPKRAVLSLAALYASWPRTPPAGYVEVAFTIAPTGKSQDLAVISSQIDWPEAQARALEIVAGAQFDPPSRACRQTMKVKFTAK